MDKFPDDCNRQICHDTMTKNQNTLVKDTRKQFYDTYIKAVADCNPEMVLEFPEKLWYEHRVTITKELLERFGKIKIAGLTKNGNKECDVIKPITNPEDLPSNIRKIIIEFIKA